MLFVGFAAAFARWTGGLELTPSRGHLDADIRLSSLTIPMATATHFFGVINEAISISDCVYQLASGKPPYRALEFIYGPSMLYLHVSLCRLLRLHLFDAYQLSWISSWLLRVAMIWFTVRHQLPSDPPCLARCRLHPRHHHPRQTPLRHRQMPHSSRLLRLTGALGRYSPGYMFSNIAAATLAV